MINNIIVCSKNKAKNEAVETVIRDYIEKYEIISLDTNSGVSATPIGDEEGINGALNRIKDAINQFNSGNLYIAMEGILTQNSHGSFLCGWTVIYNKDEDEYYYGCSAKIKVPDVIINELDKTKRLSEIVANHYNSTDDEISIIGTNGVLTHGTYTRTNEFIDSVKCAISSKYKTIKNERR